MLMLSFYFEVVSNFFFSFFVFSFKISFFKANIQQQHKLIKLAKSSQYLAIRCNFYIAR